MPKIEDKYSDSKLNNSQQDYDEKFNDAVSHPDMQALDDQGDSIARDLQGAENNTDTPESIKDDDGKDAVQRAEAQNRDAPDNNLYKPSEKNQARISKWSNKRKGIVFGGGAAAIVGLISALLLLLPMKIPGILQMVTNEAGQRVEQITEKRAKVILARAILTKFGTHTGIVITGEGAFSTLMASMREARLERKLAAKGLTIESTKDGVRLRVDGDLIGDGKNLKTDVEVMKALDGHPLTNKMVKSLIKEEIPAWRLMKRAKFAKWMRIKYGIPKYGITNSDKETTEEKVKDVDLERTNAANARTTGMFSSLITCLSGTCEMVNDEGTPAKPSEAGATNETVSATGDEAKEGVEKAGKVDPTKTLTKILVEKLGTKAIPYIGWVDLIATIDHMVYETGKNDYLGKMAAAFKGASYAAAFADWAGYGSQGALGEMDPEIMGHLAKDLDGAEEAASWVATSGKTGGVPIETKVNSDDTSEVSKVFVSWLNSAGGAQYKYVAHPVMNAYYETIGGGGFLGWAGSNLGSFLGGIASALTPDFIKNKAEDIAYSAMKEFGPFLLKAFGLTIDPLETGAKLMNNIFGGGVVSFNDFCQEIGCRKLSNPLVYEQNRTIAAERVEYLKQKGPLYALFSPEESTSVTTQLAITMPSEPTRAVSTVGKLVSNIPSRLVGIIAPQSSAASTISTYEKLYAVQGYGATAADLNKPLNKIAEEGEEDCPEVKEGDYDDCSIDKLVIDTLICYYDPETEGCNPESSGSSLSSGAGGTFRIATFNMRGASHTGGTFAGRMNLSIAAMKRHKFEVIGTQELQKPQRNYLMQKVAAEYDIFPCAKCDNDHHSVENSIMWNRTRYKMVKNGYVPNVRYFGGSKLSAPWVLLEDGNGQQMYVLNTHDPAFPENAIHRYNNGIQHAKQMNEFSKTGLPVIMTGDFNSGYSAKTSGGNVTYQRKHENTIYCTMLSAGIYDVLDLSENRTPKCPGNPKGYGNPIDHIFVSKGLEAENYTKIAGGYTNNGSDHPTYFADIIIPGAEGAAGATVAGWSWPLKKDINVGPCYGGSRQHAGMDMNSSTGNNPVYAMHTGTVTKASRNGGAAGNYVTIRADAKFNGKPVYYSYEHLKTGSITVRVGQKIGGGQKVGIAGTTGNVSLGASVAHLHIVTATTDTLGQYGALGTTFDPMKILSGVKPAPEGYKCS